MRRVVRRANSGGTTALFVPDEQRFLFARKQEKEV
jgi:hypothetical protein